MQAPILRKSPPGPRLRWQAVDPADTYVAAGPFQDPGMDALNHRGFITVGQWMMGMILGIEPEEDHPGTAQPPSEAQQERSR